MSAQIVAESLDTFDVDNDGMFVTLRIRDDAGQPSSIVFPVQCLNQLLMSIPKMIQIGLNNQYRDDSLRLVFPLENFNVELGSRDSSGAQQFILTLATGEGFAVSFSAYKSQLGSLGTELVDARHQELPQIRYS